jgi:hypothetical protein
VTNGSEDNRNTGLSSPSAPAKLSAIANFPSVTALSWSRVRTPDLASDIGRTTMRPSLLRLTASAKNASASPVIELAGYSLMRSNVVWAEAGKMKAAAANRAAKARMMVMDGPDLAGKEAGV